MLPDGPPSALPLQSSLFSSGLSDWTLPSTQEGMSLAMSLSPIPARIVQQIRAARYIDMRDLLNDNVAVRRHFEDVHGSLGVQVMQVSSRPRVREVTSLPAWVCCFLTYLAVGTSDPVVRDRLTYAVLLIREAMRHGGQGWLDYDRLFRQQAALNPNLPWNVVHPGLQATTILGTRSSGTFCNLCQECDHVAAQCALTQLQQQSVRGQQGRDNGGRGVVRICSSWNDGACSFPGSCNYRHVCSICYQSSHPARRCRSRPGSTPTQSTGGTSRS